MFKGKKNTPNKQKERNEFQKRKNNYKANIIINDNT